MREYTFTKTCTIDELDQEDHEIAVGYEVDASVDGDEVWVNHLACEEKRVQKVLTKNFPKYAAQLDDYAKQDWSERGGCSG